MTQNIPINVQALYAMIGQLTVENQVLKAKLAENAVAQTNAAEAKAAQPPGVPMKPKANGPRLSAKPT